MTATDMNRLNHAALPAETARLEAVMNAVEAARASDIHESRKARVQRIDKLIQNERLEYWLEYWVLAELARTRFDLLKLVWEQQEHPRTAPEAARRTQEAIRKRQEGMRRLGKTLDNLADPSARLWRDHVQLISRFKLKKREETVHVLLEVHGDKLLSSSDDPLEVTIPER